MKTFSYQFHQWTWAWVCEIDCNGASNIEIWELVLLLLSELKEGEFFPADQAEEEKIGHEFFCGDRVDFILLEFSMQLVISAIFGKNLQIFSNVSLRESIVKILA